MPRLPRLRRLLVAASALVAGIGSGAADPAPGGMPPPPPRFHRPPHALFADDFSSDRLAGWHADQPGTWSVRGGLLRAELPDAKQRHCFLYAGDATWTDYSLDFDVCGMRGVDKGAVVRVDDKRGLGIDLRGGGYQDLLLYVHRLPVGSARVANSNGVWHHVRIEIRGGTCRVAIDGRAVFDRRLRFSPPRHGGIALAAYTGGVAQCTVYYDNVVVASLAP